MFELCEVCVKALDKRMENRAEERKPKEEEAKMGGKERYVQS